MIVHNCMYICTVCMQACLSACRLTYVHYICTKYGMYGMYVHTYEVILPCFRREREGR